MVCVVLQQWCETPSMISEHITFVQGLIASGQLIISGPFTDDLGGGMFLLEAESTADAEALLQRDPAVAAGKLTSTIRPYQISYVRTVEDSKE